MVEALRHRGPDGDGGPAHRPGHARPHPAGDHRRRRRRPAAASPRTARSRWSPTARSTTTARCAPSLEAARPPLRHPLRLRGDRPRLRGARRRLRAPPERHLRVRALGRPRASGCVAARDQFGVKPLYWCSDGRRAGGRLRDRRAARRRPGRARSVDRVALDHYLACRFVPAPRTLFEGVRKLPAASTLIAEAGGAPRVETWREPPGEPHRDLADDELAGPARRALRRRRRAPDDVRRPLRRLPLRRRRLGRRRGRDGASARRSRPAPSRSASPATAACSTSAPPPPRAPRLIGTDHHDTAMVETDFLAELAAAMPHLEEPCGIPSAPALAAALALRRRSEVKVVLAGQGADEPHGGYGRHQAAALLSRLQLVARALASPGRRARRAALPRNARARRAARLLGGRGDAERLLRLVEITDAPVRARAARRRRRRDAAGRAARRWPRTCSATSPGATCSSRRSTSTRACSCPTAS